VPPTRGETTFAAMESSGPWLPVSITLCQPPTAAACCNEAMAGNAA